MNYELEKNEAGNDNVSTRTGNVKKHKKMNTQYKLDDLSNVGGSGLPTESAIDGEYDIFE